MHRAGKGRNRSELAAGLTFGFTEYHNRVSMPARQQFRAIDGGAIQTENEQRTAAGLYAWPTVFQTIWNR